MGTAVSMGRCIGLYLSLVFALGRAQAEDVYVSHQGNDSCPGTAERPFRTITHAYTHAAPGVTIHVAPGVYDDYNPRWGIRLNASGTPAHPIVLKSQVQGGAVLDGRNAPDRNVGIFIDGNYNAVDGFEIRNCPKGGITIWANGNRILNNEIHHNGNHASTSKNGQDGVYSNEGTRDNFYAGNSSHDNGRPGNKLDHGLYLCGENEMVINNVLYRNAGSGLQIAGYTTVRNMKVYNNVMAWNGTSGIILWLKLSGVEIKNNILYHNGRYGVGSSDAHGGGVALDHNLCFGNREGDYNFAGGRSDYTYTLGTTISAEPGFVNGTAAGFDAHLRPGSPAIKAGLNLSAALTTHEEGGRRPTTGAWDLGAYVYENAP